MRSLLRLSILIIAVYSFSACAPKSGQNANIESSQKQDTLELLVGTYTDQESKGIYLLDFDPENGTLSNRRLVIETPNPSYLAMSKDRQYVFAVNEGDSGKVSSFKWNEDRSALMPVNQQPSEGDAPCYVDLNDEENLLAIANYSSGNVLVFGVDERGMIQDTPLNFQHNGSGPVKPNQAAARAHCVKFAPNGKYLYAVDLGIDQVISYPVNDDGVVGEAVSRVTLDPGDGPRHLAFHPSKDFAFVVNELSSTVVSFKADHQSGKLERISKGSTLPDGFDGKNYCADIHVSSNGKFLYASNRGHHSIAIFSISETGELERIGIESVRGDWPRNFILSPDNNFLLVANQNSSNITVFAVNPETGLLTFTGNQVTVSRPVALKF